MQEHADRKAEIEKGGTVDAVFGPIGVPDTYQVNYHTGLGSNEIDRMNDLGFALSMVTTNTSGPGIRVWWEEDE